MPQPLAIAAGKKIAFDRKGGIFVATYPNVRNAVLVGQGQDPDLSPDGQRIAFEESSGSGDRSFCIRDAATGRRLAVRPGTLPHFSPDGTKVAFSRYVGNQWTAWITDATLKQPPLNLTGSAKDGPAFISGWTGNGLLVTYADTIGGPLYALKPSGEPVKKVRVSDITRGSDTMIPFGCAWSDDLSRIAYEAQTDESSGGDDPGPLIALFLYDFRTGKSRRITPKGLNAGNPVWYAPGLLAFTGNRNTRHPSPSAAYLLDIATGAMRPFLENANTVAFGRR